MVVGKRGRKDPRQTKKMPRRAGVKTQKAYMMALDKSVHTFQKYRTGYNTAWNKPKTRRYMIEHGFKPPGQWDSANLQDGRMFASPREVAFITEEIAGTLLWKAYFEDKASNGQLFDISKMLSFAYQLKTGEVKGNFKCVKQTWGNMNPDRMQPSRKSHKATVYLAPEQVKTSLMTPWNQNTGLALPDWSSRYMGCWHWNMNGARSKVDLARIRHSAQHYVNYAAGWQCTEYLGGRAKVEKRLGERPWKAYATCTCVGGHNGLPLSYADQEPLFGDDGNPLQPPTWNTCCPLSCFQVIGHWLRRSGLTPTRVFPKWSYKTCTFTKECFGRNTLIVVMRDFVQRQGANPQNLVLSPNGGRKAFGSLCRRHEVPYEQGFECHGDQAKNWKRYQSNVKWDRSFKRRTQSPDPEVCTAAHRRILAFWNNLVPPSVKLEPKVEPKPEPPAPPAPPAPVMMAISPELKQFQKVMELNIRVMGGGAELNKLLNMI
jgi:hypothetical protein